MDRGPYSPLSRRASRAVTGLASVLWAACLCLTAADSDGRSPFASVRDFGARGDGVADDTAAIQAALDSGRRILFPRGTYQVQMNRLTLADGAYLVGEGRQSRIRSAEVSEAQVALFKAVGRSDITIESLCFETPKSTQAALLFASCSAVTVSRCRAVNCQLVYVGSAAVAALHDISSVNAFFDLYDQVTSPAHFSNTIAIEGNECVGDNVRGRGGISLSAIFISYANNVRVANNDLTGYLHGITWWGGNANTKGPAPNGAMANPRKCKGLAITGNTIHDIEMGGIWGSMGEGVAVTGNTVLNCGDVGIDFEGCFSCTATGNIVEDCFAACLCTVFDNRGIVFSGNSCTQHTAGWWIAAVRNQHDSTANQDVSFVGNHFTAATGMSAVVSEGVQHLFFQGNSLRNVVLQFRDPAAKHRMQTVCGNGIFFDVAAATPFAAVRIGPVSPGGHVLFQGNSLATQVSQPEGSSGLEVLAATPATERYLLSGNLISGWGGRDLLADPVTLLLPPPPAGK
jgi:hypothetical protein